MAPMGANKTLRGPPLNLFKNGKNTKGAVFEITSKYSPKYAKMTKIVKFSLLVYLEL